MTLLLLVDGSSYLYRAFYALPDLRNREGFPTGAIKGVLSMLRRLDDDYKAERKAVVFDAKGKTFREDIFPDYKANRPPMPEPLALQIAPLHEAIRANGWPVIVMEGVEADDVIGTLARRATESGMETLISTGDKDLAQLVCPHVRLMNTMTGEILDEEGVKGKFGVPPNRIIDYLALIGDTSDNIPGVEKCGPKTAVKWLSGYGSLKAIIAHSDEIGGVVGQNLRNHLDFFPLAQKLATIDCGLPSLPDPDCLAPTPKDTEALKSLYQRFEFSGWSNELREAEKPEKTPAQTDFFGAAQTPVLPIAGGAHRKDYETVQDEAALETWLQRIHDAPLVALDTETTSLDSFSARIVGISLASSPGTACYIPLGHQGPDAAAQLPYEKTLEKLKPWLESAQHLKVGQNLKFDQHVLSNHGILLKGIAHDVLLQSYVLESDRRHALDQLAGRHLGLEVIPYEALCGKGVKQIGFAQVPIDRAAEYSAEDADLTLRLSNLLFPRIEREAGLKRVYQDIELPAREVLFCMERTGVLIDAPCLRQQSHELGQKILELEKEAYEMAGQPFNLNSPRQLAEILFERQGLPVKKKTPGGLPSTDEEVLAALALDYPLPKLLLAHRSLSKLKNTYTDKLPRMIHPATGRVHTHFSQTTAVTGRLASSEPNLQNIPVRDEEGRRIRNAFIASEGCRIVSADYSQIELRIMAHISEDTGLLQAFSEGKDVHRATAAEIFGIATQAVTSDQRRIAKTINFGLIYGMSAFGLAKNLGLERSVAQAYIERYFTRYPGVSRYMEETREKAKAQGYVETIFGRRLELPEIRSGNKGRQQGAERAAINAPMQGTAADLIKLAMIATQNWLDAEKLQSRLILQVHDELVLEVPEKELPKICETLPQLMGHVGHFKIPLVIDLGQGKNWGEAH